MDDIRLSKDTTAYYSSFQEVAKAFGCREQKKRTNDQEKLAAQKEKFLGKCRVCGKSLSWVEGTNAIVCINPECKGIKKTYTDDEGNEKNFYIPVTRTVDDRGMEIALNLFA